MLGFSLQPLTDIHIVKVIIHKGAVWEAKVTQKRSLLSLELLLKRLYSCLYLGSSSLLLVGADDLITLFEILLLAYIEVDG